MGWREDWRFADYRKRLGWLWYPASFFVAYVSQHIMLVGLTLPFYAVHQSSEPLSVWDALAAVLCLGGVAFAAVADNQLHEFMAANEAKASAGRGASLWSSG